jgi:hypothetical protein
MTFAAVPLTEKFMNLEVKVVINGQGARAHPHLLV